MALSDLDVEINFTANSNDDPLQVVQLGHYDVGIESPQIGSEYLWFDDLDGLNLLHTGDRFQPKRAGNHYVACRDLSSDVLGEIEGFALSERSADDVLGPTLEWLREGKKASPWFAFVHLWRSSFRF